MKITFPQIDKNKLEYGKSYLVEFYNGCFERVFLWPKDLKKERNKDNLELCSINQKIPPNIIAAIYDLQSGVKTRTKK